MADQALTFILEKVTQILVDYTNLISGAENELNQLKNDLDHFKSFLQEASNKKLKKEAQFKAFERQIREVVYDAEDIIDKCLTIAALSKNKSFFRKLNPNRITVAEQVEQFREEKIKPLYDDARTMFANIKIADLAETSDDQATDKLKKVPLIREDNVVGFKDEEETLMRYISEERDELDIISIVGMPGLGKTTLAWKIFKSKKLEFDFPTRIWVYVSQEFTTRDVLLSMMKGFTKNDMTAVSDIDLLQMVRDSLRHGKFFLVLDDVWTVAAWSEIRKILPNDCKMSKVLITSRHLEVGEHANHSRIPHNLRFFTEAESWELLQLEVFGRVNTCPQELEETGRCIANQCDGLPLAVVIIGGILVNPFSSTQPTHIIKEAWSKVSDNVSEHVKNDKEERISDIVAMSYNNLTDDLKDCFLYMGVFPEDHDINAWTLTCLWIAEGFVPRKGEKTLEEIAEENLNELINRNLVIVGQRKPNGQVKTCRVHDVIRAFCINKSAYNELNLFTEIKLSRSGMFEPPISDLQKFQKLRRISIHSNLQKFLSERFKDLKVRSFLCFYKESNLLPPKYNSVIADACHLLRVLDSNSFRFNIFPAKITRLIHLRYITLSIDDMEILPDSLNELWNLQTLVIDSKSRVLLVKANIWNLIQLRHLKSKASIVFHKPNEGKGGQNIQTLSRLSPENCTSEVFNKVKLLKKLGIRGKLENLLKSNSLTELKYVEKLKLVYDIEYGSIAENPLSAIPEHNQFPPNLKHLTISNTYLDWKHISTLGRIVGLQVLKLKDNAFTGQKWNTTAGGFSHLGFLLIENNDLALWETSSDHFPGLKCLVLSNCKRLTTIPMCLAKGLEVLDIDGVSGTVVESAKKIEEYKMKNQMDGAFKLTMGPGCK